MLFKKKEYRFCVNCERAAEFDEDHMLCIKKGIVALDGKCRKFTYDPCKRIPPKAKALDLDKYRDEDFSL